MSGGAKPHQRELGNSRSRGDAQVRAESGSRGYSAYDRTCASCTVSVQKVGRYKDLGVEVIVGTARTAQAAAANEHGSIRHEDCYGVICPGNLHGVQLCPSSSSGVPQLRSQLRRVVVERVQTRLSTSNENCSVGKRDTIRETARIGHRLGFGDSWVCLWCTYRDDIGTCASVTKRQRSQHCCVSDAKGGSYLFS